MGKQNQIIWIILGIVALVLIANSSYIKNDFVSAKYVMYRYSDGNCTTISLSDAEMTNNDYATLADCLAQNSSNFSSVIYYRYSQKNNNCNPMFLFPTTITGNDYLTSTECESHIIGVVTETPRIYYRSINSCTSISLKISEVTTNDYSTLDLCNASTTKSSDFFSQYKWWIIGGVGLFLLLILIKK
jgi:hypothetical protein